MRIAILYIDKQFGRDNKFFYLSLIVPKSVHIIKSWLGYCHVENNANIM